jgi:glycerate kinase
VRVLICPDKFAGTLGAVEVAGAVAAGWASAAPGDELVRRPLADGGPGFVDVVATAVGGARVAVPTVDPLGRPVPGEVLVAGATAYVESAQACGLHLLAPAERDPRITTSYGLGALLTAAIEAGVREVVVGLGGSGTNDAGAGMFAALGTPVLDSAGFALPYGGAALVAAAAVDGVPRTREVRFVAATDVDSPLTGIHGASSVFGPQKGATRADVLLLDDALARFAEVLETLPSCPAGLATHAGAGAAGGLGAALLALGGRVVSGIGLVRELTGLDRALDETDLVITGEGSFDAQSLHGKVVAGVAAAARDRGLPCLVLAGQASTGRREAAAAGVTDTYTLVSHFGTVADALARPEEGLFALARRLAGQWSRGE